jgi:hypothetical protein
VPIDSLIANKVISFSHIKNNLQSKLLKAILENNIDLYDHETIVDINNRRLIGFGRYAGIVGAYRYSCFWFKV